MNQPNAQEEEWPPKRGPDSPPIDFSREEAAYEKVRERMVREHPGKIALVHQDEVIGAFDTADEAFLEFRVPDLGRCEGHRSPPFSGGGRAPR